MAHQRHTPGPVSTAFRCCGVRIEAVGLAEAADQVVEFARGGNGRAVHLCNAYTLSLVRRDQSMRGVIARGDLNLADGMPLVWIGRRLGFHHMTTRVYGPDLMLAAMESGTAYGVAHYLYGSSPEVVARLERNLRERFRDIVIVAAESPPFRPLEPDEEKELVRRVTQSGAQVVWVGLGTPYQDQFVDQFRDRLNVTLVAIGAAFDFHAGTKRQAPAWIRNHGWEWAFRLATEPRRLWRRYLLGNVSFLAGVVRDGVSTV